MGKEAARRKKRRKKEKLNEAFPMTKVEIGFVRGR